MLVCPSLSAARTCLLAESLGSVPRCSSSHLCLESDIQMEGAPPTKLRPVPSAGLHMLSPGSRRLCKSFLFLLVKFSCCIFILVELHEKDVSLFHQFRDTSQRYLLYVI